MSDGLGSPQSPVQATSAAAADAAPRLVGADGLTNKERRKAKQAEKRKRLEDGGDGEITASMAIAAEAAADNPAAKVNGTTEGADADADEEDEAEVEAISHKEKRKRRKLEKKGLVPADGTNGDESMGGQSAAPSAGSINALPARSAYAVWVGNMNFMTSQERLQSWFEEKGIEGISRVHMPKGAKKFEQNKGFAYVDVPSAEAMQSAVGLSEGNLDGRRLLIKSASDFTGRPAIDPAAAALAGATGANAVSAGDAAGRDGAVAVAVAETMTLPGSGKTGLTKTAQRILRSQKHAPGPTLFVGNLSFNSTKESLQEMLERSAVARAEWSKKAAEERKRKARKEAIKERKAAKAKKAAAAKAKAKANKDDSSDSDSDSDSSSDDGEGEDAEETAAAESDAESEASSSSSSSSSSSVASEDLTAAVGIRKIRMGEFEDTGKCKGFAFIDFDSAAHATATLIDPHNYRLDGRELKMEFAGVDAIRRGASKDLLPAAQREAPRDAGGRGRGRGRGRGGPPGRGGRGGGRGDFGGRERTHERSYGGGGGGDGEGGFAQQDAVPFSDARPGHKETQAERQARREKEGPRRRAKPGAALANAQRGKTGIDTSGVEGTRVVFE